MDGLSKSSTYAHDFVGIGKAALKLLIEKLRESYRSIYCIIQKSNIASLKMLKYNGFQIEKFEDDQIRLSREL